MRAETNNIDTCMSTAGVFSDVDFTQMMSAVPVKVGHQCRWLGAVLLCS